MLGQLNVVLEAVQDVVDGLADAFEQQLNIGFQPQPWQFGVWQLNGPINGPNEGAPAENPPLVAPGAGGGLGTFGLGRGFFEKIPLSGDSWKIIFMGGRGRGLPATSRNSQVARNLRAPDWREVHLPPFQKDVYREHITTAERPIEEVEAYRQANDITVTGRDVPKPILHVNEGGFPEHISKVIEARNSGSTLSAIEAQCWPVALRGKDLVAIIQDASKGKPLAYLVPAIIHVMRQPVVLRGSGPLVLVVTATRVTALQVREIADELNAGSPIRTLYLQPGEPRQPQLKQLVDGAHICVATPGRLVSFMEECQINLRCCTYLVLDEVDRMIMMGFEKQLRIIANNIRPDRQTLVWLSSRSMDANRLIEDLTSEYVTVSVGAAAREDHKCQVQHDVIICETVEKEQKLVALFNDILREESDKAVVFVERKQAVEDIVSFLRLQGWPAVGIHGKKTAYERDYALNSLKFSKVPIMVATDVAACALAVDKVRLVVSYDYPSSASEYSRRAGYAARPDGRGVKYTFISPDETQRAKELISFLREAKQVIPPELRMVANKIKGR
ncbi:probable ATP-dependent RNA helicase DDX5 [Rhipicephalus sanguineus]|uniref:RNA helicase n=1 Tax=Rhipicephalus sanguineus TaxID=34632 RepID=A0A9D4SNT5_RHISA|nr:probable ATP-dependent RNA helicase DDX5 [Rhipicephalus sanguineus]KAH7935640.1 hypothetical protein HPB52_010904 [Rhipicephalus sanguineus]